MLIKELILKDFGKFHQKRIKLSPGINLIYGENEAGKTTVHSFIRGMILGIEKPRGRESKDELYSKYIPWETPTLYAGAMQIESEGKDYFIERNFYKDTKYLKITDLSTGREQYQDTAQVPIPFEAITKASYRNTISMEQNRSATDKELEAEIQNYIANMTTSKNSEVDINLAFRILNEKKKALNLRDLEEELHNLEQKLEKLPILKGRILTLEKQLQVEHEEPLPEELNPKKQLLHRDVMISGCLGILLLVVGLFTKQVALCGLSIAFFAFMCINLLKMEQRKNEKLKEDSKKQIQEERLRWEIEQLEEETIQLEPLQEVWKERKKKHKEAMENLAAIQLAIDIIEKLSTEIHDGFGSALNQKVSALAEKITAGTYQKLYVDEKLDIKVKAKDRIVPLSQLSAGTMDQLYLSLRLTAGDLLYQGKNMPFILDDSFALYDDRRFEAVLNLLAEQNRQIIIFSCHRREQEQLDKMSVMYQYLEL